MANIRNEEGITEIKIERHFIFFCPMGGKHYDADVVVTFVPDEEIMDYCDTEECFKSMDGGDYTVEAATDKIFSHIKTAVNPKKLSVVLRVTNGVHSPVEVKKEGWSDAE